MLYRSILGIVLDVFQAFLSGLNVNALRPRLEHAQMMTKSDIIRLGKLGGKDSFVWMYIAEDLFV